MSGGESSTSGVVFYVLAAMVGMALGFVTIWSQIRGQNRAAKQEAEAARTDLEKRMRDYLDLRLTNVQERIEHLRESLARVERKLNRDRDRQQQENG